MNVLADAVSPEAGEAYSRLLGLVAIIGFGCVAFAVFCISLVKASRHRTRGWTIAAVVSSVAMLGSLVAAVDLVTETVAGAGAGGAKTLEMPREITSSDGRVSMKIPASWKVMPDLHPAAVLAAGDKSLGQYGMVLPTGRASFPGSLADFDLFVTEGLKKALKDPSVSDPEEIEIGGYRAIRREVSGLKGTEQLAYEQVLVETRSTYYHLLLWTGASERAAAENDFRNITGSFAAEAGPPMPE
jgi:hypothetical protein